jgi:hypothetical protein
MVIQPLARRAHRATLTASREGCIKSGEQPLSNWPSRLIGIVSIAAARSLMDAARSCAMPDGMPGYTMPGTRPRPCFSSMVSPQRTVMAIMRVKHGDGGSVSACGSPSGSVGTVACASVPPHRLRSGPTSQYPVGGVADREVVGWRQLDDPFPS